MPGLLGQHACLHLTRIPVLPRVAVAHDHDHDRGHMDTGKAVNFFFCFCECLDGGVALHPAPEETQGQATYLPQHTHIYVRPTPPLPLDRPTNRLKRSPQRWDLCPTSLARGRQLEVPRRGNINHYPLVSQLSRFRFRFPLPSYPRLPRPLFSHPRTRARCITHARWDV